MNLLTNRTFTDIGYGSRSNERMVIWSGHKSPAGKIPLIYCHGAGALSDQVFLNPGPAVVLEYLGRNNLFCMSGDFGVNGPIEFGSNEAMNAMNDAITEIGSVYGVRTDKLAYLGTSMGGMNALNHIQRNPNKLVAAALMIPVVALDIFHDRHTGAGNFGELIETAYGGSAAYEAAIPTHDPVHANMYPSYIPLKDKIYIWNTGSDTTVLPSDVTLFTGLTGVKNTVIPGLDHVLTWDQKPVREWLIPRLSQAQG